MRNIRVAEIENAQRHGIKLQEENGSDRYVTAFRSGLCNQQAFHGRK